MDSDNSKACCRFGSERFDVISDAAICRFFEHEFGDQDSSREPDVVFAIRRPDGKNNVPSRGAQGESGRRAIHYSNRYCDFTIRFGAPMRVDVALKRSARMSLAKRLPVFTQRALTRKFNSVDEQEYGYLVYKAVLWILFLHCIGAGRLFLHASGYVRDGRCVLLCGTGGVGKTSLSAKILARRDTLFVSDDIVTASPSGQAFANGMYVHAYPYNNLEQALPFQRMSGPMALLNRSHWRVRKALLGPKGACRRLSPFELHGCKPASAAGNCLAGIVWLSRDGTSDSGLKRADPHDFVQAHMDVLRDEVRSAFDFYADAADDGWEPANDGMPASLERAVLETLSQLTDQVTVWKFNVAENRSAAENADVLLRELEERSARAADAGSVEDDVSR